MRTRTGWYIAPNVFGALAEAASDRVQAFTGLPASALFYGIGPDGTFYSDHLFQGGGQGASGRGDGHSGLLYPTSAGNTSVELFETRVPALVLEKAFTADSGGPGRQRGGLGQVISARKLENDGKPCQVGLYPMGVLRQVPGLFGGRPGGRSGRDRRPARRERWKTSGWARCRSSRRRRSSPSFGSRAAPDSGTPWSAPSRRCSGTSTRAASPRRAPGATTAASSARTARIDRAASERLRAERAGRPAAPPPTKTRPVEAD